VRGAAGNRCPYRDCRPFSDVPSDPAAIVYVLVTEYVSHVLLFGKDNPMMNGDYERAEQEQNGIQGAQH
jgi:hypothetical protein